MCKLAAVVIKLHHLFHTLQPAQLPVRHPSSIQNLIGRLFHVTDAVILRRLPHSGTLQHFQKAKLQLMRPHPVNPVKRSSEAHVVLIGQAGNQIQMDVNIPALSYLPYRCFQPVYIRHPPDRLERIRIHRLHADLQLRKPRAEPPQKRNLLIP